MNSSKLILAGGSGFLGQVLAAHFAKRGWQIVVLTRSPKPRSDGATRFALQKLSVEETKARASESLVRRAPRSLDSTCTARPSLAVAHPAAPACAEAHQG